MLLDELKHHFFMVGFNSFIPPDILGVKNIYKELGILALMINFEDLLT